MPRQLTCALAVVLLAATAFAETPRDPQSYTRLLLPFHASLSTPGGTWFVQWWVRNEGDIAADAFPLATSCGLPPPPGPDGPRVFMRPNPALPAQTTVTCLAGDVLPSFPVPPFVPVVSSSSGALLYVETARKSEVAIGGTVRWLSQSGNGAPVALRAIPQESFIRGTRSIMPIPFASGRRYSLRVYALPESLRSGGRATVRVYDMQPAFVTTPQEQLRATIAIELVMPQSRLLSCLNACDLPSVDYTPATAALFNLFDGSDRTGIPPTYRIEIDPESDDLRWWAVVSATDPHNEIVLYEPRS